MLGPTYSEKRAVLSSIDRAFIVAILILSFEQHHLPVEVRQSIQKMVGKVVVEVILD